MDMMPLASFDMEADLLGAIMRPDKNFIDDLSDLQPHHFAYEAHKAIFKTAVALKQKGEPVNFMSVKNDMERQGLDADLGALVKYVQNTAMPVYKSERFIIERAVARDAVAKAQDFISQVYEQNGVCALDLVGTLSKDLDDSIITRSDAEATYTLTDLYKVGITEFAERYENGEPSGIKTGIQSLDDYLYGLQRGNLYIMAGRPAMGKTAVSMTIAQNVSMNADYTGSVMVFNAEMSKEQLGMRSLASIAEVSLSDIQNGHDDNGSNFSKMESNVGRVIESRMLVDVRASISMAQIERKCKQVKNRSGLDLVLIDYLGLIETPNLNFQNDNSRVAYISRECKKLAKNLDVPVILLCQLSRKVEERADKRPMMSDLRDSGAIEQDADSIVMLYRDDAYKGDSVTHDNMIEMIVVKQRMGPQGTAYAYFDGAHSRVIDPDQTYVERTLEIRKEKAKPKKNVTPSGRPL